MLVVLNTILLLLVSKNALLMLFFGVVFGIIIGATPGLSPAMGVALLLPISYGMEPELAFILFVSCYQASNYGGSITAIALNAPGTASAVVTAIDGYELTKRGRIKEALTHAIFASTVGGLIAAVILILSTKVIANYALTFGPAEYFSLCILGLTSVVAFERKNKLEALASVILGLLLATIGLDSQSGEERLTFGFFELYDGISFIPALIGLFALGEILSQIDEKRTETKTESQIKEKVYSKVKILKEFLKYKFTLIRSSIVGTLIGVVPGAGATVASFLAYGFEKKSAKDEASPKGIIASEAANSSSVGGALVPLLALGIPGSATDAVLLGALSLHGLTAGPKLFETEPTLIANIYGSLILANILILILGMFGNKIWIQIVKFKSENIHFFVIPICLIGSYLSKNQVFDIYVCIFFGVLGYLLKKLKFKPAAIILGLVLGKMIEDNFKRAYIIGGFNIFYEKPISLAFLIFSVFCFIKIPKKEK